MQPFPRYWPKIVRGIHRWPVKGQWRGTLMFSFICAWKKRLSKQFETLLLSLWRHSNYARPHSGHHCAWRCPSTTWDGANLYVSSCRHDDKKSNTFFLLSWFRMAFVNQMTSSNVANKISLNITEHASVNPKLRLSHSNDQYNVVWGTPRNVLNHIVA